VSGWSGKASQGAATVDFPSLAITTSATPSFNLARQSRTCPHTELPFMLRGPAANVSDAMYFFGNRLLYART
jgi:hypothetical protein